MYQKMFPRQIVFVIGNSTPRYMRIWALRGIHASHCIEHSCYCYRNLKLNLNQVLIQNLIFLPLHSLWWLLSLSKSESIFFASTGEGRESHGLISDDDKKGKTLCCFAWDSVTP